MNKRLGRERMARISEGVTGSSMLALWDEAMRARQSEAELLEALEKAAIALEQGPTSEVDRAERIILAAIAKAKGEP